eukprot:7390731-Prymnesium_polylepis.1
MRAAAGVAARKVAEAGDWGDPPAHAAGGTAAGAMVTAEQMAVAAAASEAPMAAEAGAWGDPPGRGEGGW